MLPFAGSWPDFDPEAGCVCRVSGPTLNGPADGEATITQESPCHITIEFEMRTPGVVVLSDTWDAGWHARVKGTQTNVLRMNHNFRGVVAPAGKGVIQYDYEPASFYLGVKIAAAAAGILLIWAVVPRSRMLPIHR